MHEYHKIQTVFLRDPNNNYKTLLEGQYSLPEFKYLRNNRWTFTEKVDGTNIRVLYNGYPLIKEVEFRGKTDKAEIPKFLFEKLKEMFPIEKMEAVFNFDRDYDEDIPFVCLYGEGYGAKIQKGGGNYRQDQSFVLIDVKIGGRWWLRRNDVQELANKLEIECTPVIGNGTLDNMAKLAKHGFNSYWGDFTAEGIVARPEVELFARDGSRIITKLKYKDFSR